MAQLDKLSPNITSYGLENGVVNFLHVAAGGGNSLFGCLALDYTHSSTGAITTVYFWPNSSGTLHTGTTAPTAATQDTAGAAV